jgi:GTP-binding protein EngB required for normal cell division
MVIDFNYIIPSETRIISLTGRPNAGKTTLINLLSQNKFPVGKYAGTTKKIRSVYLRKDLAIVDFPGYGRILKRSKRYTDDIKDQIILFLEKYSDQIVVPIHIIASNSFLNASERLEKKGFLPIDIEFVEFLSEITHKEVIVILNKVDKLKNRSEELKKIRKHFENQSIMECSLRKKEGIDEIKKVIRNKLGKNYESLIK